MKIGNDTIGISLADKIKLFIFNFLIYVLLILLLDWFFDGTIKSWDVYLLKGIIYSILFTGIIYFTLKTMTKRVATKLQIPLAEGEELEAHGVANMFIGKEAVGGKLGITPEALIFHSHKFNMSTGTVRINYDMIKAVKPTRIMWLINTGIKVYLKDGDSFVFVVSDRKVWLELIAKKLN
ncbi:MULTISPECIES: hypothetical protein [Myroides]|uniref:GRAM domain-containing protein n=1 Tax=Myroides albus TaxID=2562892 RepID=A0A6I3LNJ1_9FLAO|nr:MULTISPECIES: hypothetical protein [Myroides]MTG98880.1 hypothetical protein [Myroides albus]MVX34920.1 hypothetical protein [Myroides sp. LoEW2-1]UVD79562.1 hypothetical protein NWE55_15775 [Myroides albus]